jgi:hypothetical protein
VWNECRGRGQAAAAGDLQRLLFCYTSAGKTTSGRWWCGCSWARTSRALQLPARHRRGSCAASGQHRAGTAGTRSPEVRDELTIQHHPQLGAIQRGHRPLGTERQNLIESATRRPRTVIVNWLTPPPSPPGAHTPRRHVGQETGTLAGHQRGPQPGHLRVPLHGHGHDTVPGHGQDTAELGCVGGISHRQDQPVRYAAGRPYFPIADTGNMVRELDRWLRRRLRQIRWKESRTTAARRHNQTSHWVLAAWGCRETGAGGSCGWSRAGVAGDRCAARAPAGAVTGSRVADARRVVQPGTVRPARSAVKCVAGGARARR